MRTTFLVFTAFLVMLASAVATADANKKLYRHYEFGMSRAEIQAIPDVYDCSAEYETDMLCLDGQKFADQAVRLGFEFLASKLVAVTVMSEYTQNKHIAFMAVLRSKFELIGIESGGQKMDYIVESKQHSKATFFEKTATFERQALANEEARYIFLDKAVFKKLLPIAENMMHMIMQAPKRVRTIEYIKGLHGDKLIIGMQFVLPHQVAQLMRDQAEQIDDDF